MSEISVIAQSLLGQLELNPEAPGFFKAVLDAMTSGYWWGVAALAVSVLAYVAQHFGAKKFPALKGVFATALIGTILAFFGALATALPAGSAITAAVAFAALKVAAVSVPGKLLLQLCTEFLLSKFGLASKGNPEELQAQAQGLGAKAGAELKPLSSKDLVNK